MDFKTGKEKRQHDLRLRKNAEGYPDPTAYEAIKKVDDDLDRLNKTIRTIKSLCDLAGFSVEERIVLKDVKTGKIWR